MSLRVPPREVAQRVVMKHQSLGNRESKMNLLFICIWHVIKAGDVSVVRFCRSVGCSVGVALVLGGIVPLPFCGLHFYSPFSPSPRYSSPFFYNKELTYAKSKNT